MVWKRWATALILSAVALTGSAAAETQFGSPDQQRVLIAGICQTQLTIGEAGCLCLAERSIGELSDPQREYLIMTAIQPPVAERMAMARSQADLKVIAGFIESARTACAAPAEPGQGATESATSPAQ
jgi:hypothetical protein